MLLLFLASSIYIAAFNSYLLTPITITAPFHIFNPPTMPSPPPPPFVNDPNTAEPMFAPQPPLAPPPPEVQGGHVQQPALAPTSNRPLNPMAEEWHPHRSPEPWRCLYLTFSNGHPIPESEIYRFFTKNYGNCVEKVYVHWPEPGNRRSPAQFGKVVFKDCLPLLMTECGTKELRFTINGKPLWCKRFDPKKANASKAARNGNE